MYISGKLMFLGDGYIAIKMFIEQSGNNPAVVERFRTQLEQREAVNWQKTETET